MRAPEVNFIAGDFMNLAIPEASFDVTLSLEVLSHVADQPAFIRKLAHITRPGGYLLMATQNRPVCKLNRDIPPAQPGQLRRWVNSAELRSLVQPWFDVAELRSIEPIGMGGYLRVVNAPKVNRAMNFVTGRRYEQIKERLGLGFTLMLKARKRG
jgi:SAM-dependent methyltransferase